jgi:acetyl esterase
MKQRESCTKRLRPRLLQLGAKAFFHGLSSAGRLHPAARPSAHNVEVIRNISYGGSTDAAHRLDIYRPIDAKGSLPVVLYVHGGGFQLLSKDTHWLMGLIFARAGYVVCNISYRLAPRYPFPAALEDTCSALEWVARHVAEYGGDASKLVLAGESAGANLVCALTVAMCYRRIEAYAQRAWNTGLVPRAVILGCGILQVSDPGRFARRRKLPRMIAQVINDVSAGYIRGVQAGAELADPLVILERGDPPDRALPPMFAFAGTRDPVLDDTRRVAHALTRLRVPHEVRYYPGELHAFHALMMRKAARDCWRDKLAFLERELSEPVPKSTVQNGGLLPHG